jgi:hypothetical protein
LERDYTEYGYEFGTAPWRLKQLAEALPLIEQRLAKLTPPPIGSCRSSSAGKGEKVTPAARRRARQRVEHLRSGGRVRREERDPRRLVRQGRSRPDGGRGAPWRSVPTSRQLQDYLDAGATHIMLMTGDPFDFASLGVLLGAANS